MRTTLACERCRKSKVKCHHSGQPPCEACTKHGIAETCVLSTPVYIRKSGNTLPAKRKATEQLEPEARVVGDLRTFLANIPSKVKEEAVGHFRQRFPECGFLHLSESPSKDFDSLKLAAILVLVGRFMEDADFESSRLREMVEPELLKRVTGLPDLNVIQSLLIIAHYHWGEGVGHKSWMYSGMAFRMAQCLLAMREEAVHPVAKVGIKEGRDIQEEIENRTIWSCFALDKLLSCGRMRPPMFQLEEI